MLQSRLITQKALLIIHMKLGIPMTQRIKIRTGLTQILDPQKFIDAIISIILLTVD